MNSFLFIIIFRFVKSAFLTATETKYFVFFGMRKHSAS